MSLSVDQSTVSVAVDDLIGVLGVSYCGGMHLLITDGLAAFRVRDIGGLTDLFVGLGEEVFCALCVIAQLVLIRLLSGIELLVGLNDVVLSSGQIGVFVRIDVDDGCLGEGYSDTGERRVEDTADEQALFCHG